MGIHRLFPAAGLAVLTAGANPHADIGGYKPASNVIEHSQMVLDIKDMTSEVKKGNYAKALDIWVNGSHSCKSTTKRRTLKGFVNDQTVQDKLNGEAFFDSFTSGNTQGIIKIPGQGRLGLKTNFWNKFVTDALTNEGDFKNLPAEVSADMRNYAINKGVLGVLTMYTAHEMESAINKAIANNTDDAKGAPHAWDEAWAFYYGSQDKGANSAWEFTMKRDSDFTVDSNGDRVTEAVEGKTIILDYFLEGLKASRNGTKDVAKMIQSRDNIYRIWALSAIRAALKYAFTMQKPDESGVNYHPKYHMEAYAYFLSAAGWVAQANQAAAKNVLGLLDFTKSNETLGNLYCDVSAALIPAFAALGLDCKKVGTYKKLGTKTCSNLPACPADQTLPKGLSSYVPDTETTAGANVNCGGGDDHDDHDDHDHNTTSEAHTPAARVAWCMLAIAFTASTA